MENDAATLYCPNEACQAPNPIAHNFCQRCSTPLLKRYLWAVADGVKGSSGEILADRYLIVTQSVVLDTKPGLLPQTPELEDVRPYLRLIPFRLHVPSVYGVLPGSGDSEPDILLLENPPLHSSASGEVSVCSSLTTAWRDATSMRQLNWLWQIAHLWQPLASEGVAQSLLDPKLLRVEGSLVRLLELQSNENTPELTELGEFWWRQFLPGAKPAISDFCKQICRYLTKGEIHNTEQLIQILDKGLAEIGRSQTSSIKITTKTDTGPSRQRNEDACYPPSGTVVNKPPQPTALAIVCDGIGGHAGGNVASSLAIETIQQQVQQLTKVPHDHIDATILLADLERAAAAANDKISQRNDSENRQGRQRMGTTLVMGLPIAHEMYIAHVGDSRAYWITASGCHQVTLDDDVASREVRLGYAVYRDAVQQSGAGSLVQALGMNPSTSLHPTAQRFILDEDSVFLLCSDGLSDFDRVEQYWETEVQPIVFGKTNVTNATDKLVEIATSQNGHDNITVALIHYQTKFSEPQTPLDASVANIEEISDVVPKTTVNTVLQPTSSQKTQVIPPEVEPTKKPSRIPLQLAFVSVLVLGLAGLAYALTQLRSPNPTSTPAPTNLRATEVLPPEPLPNADNTGNRFVEIIRNVQFSKTPKDPPGAALVSVPDGSVLQILDEKLIGSRSTDSWLHLQICSVKSSTNSRNQTLKRGEKLYIRSSKLTNSNFNDVSDIVTPNQCPAVTPPVETYSPRTVGPADSN